MQPRFAFSFLFALVGCAAAPVQDVRVEPAREHAVLQREVNGDTAVITTAEPGINVGATINNQLDLDTPAGAALFLLGQANIHMDHIHERLEQGVLPPDWQMRHALCLLTEAGHLIEEIPGPAPDQLGLAKAYEARSSHRFRTLLKRYNERKETR